MKKILYILSGIFILVLGALHPVISPASPAPEVKKLPENYKSLLIVSGWLLNCSRQALSVSRSLKDFPEAKQAYAEFYRQAKKFHFALKQFNPTDPRSLEKIYSDLYLSYSAISRLAQQSQTFPDAEALFLLVDENYRKLEQELSLSRIFLGKSEKRVYSDRFGTVKTKQAYPSPGAVREKTPVFKN